jgi:arabinogalactan oligomer / maltooligosaccharide transport system substrate-binding protein
MKKFTILMLALTIIFVMTACGTAKDAAVETSAAPEASTAASTEAAIDAIKPEDGAKLLVWDAADQRPFFESIAKQFQEKYNVEVTFEEVAPADQPGKFTTDGPAEVAADVGVIPHDNLGKMVAAGLFLPNDIYREETTQDNADSSVQGATFDNVLYGYPKSIETYALVYNKDLVKTVPKTFEEIIEFAKTYNDPAKNKYAFMFEIGNFYFDYAFIAGSGGYVFGKEGTDKADIGLNNEGAVKGAAFFQSLKKDVLPMKSADVTYDIKKGLFTSGTLAIDLNGPWTIGDYKAAGINFGVAPIPTIDGKPAVSFAGIKIMGVNSFTKYPNAAKLFAHFATTKEAQLENFKLTGALPSNKAAADDPSIKNDEITSGFLEQLKNSQAMPSIPEMGNIWVPMGAALGDMWNDGKDPKATLDNAVKQIKETNEATK